MPLHLKPLQIQPLLARHLVIFLLVSLLGLLNITGYAQPFVQSFSPISAVPGASVTIQGSGFSTTPSANQVFFGAVKGVVTSSTNNILVATVPAGATPGPIMVHVSGLWAYSGTNFQPKSATIYPLDGGAFKLGDTAVTSYYPRNALFADLDVDGKPDLLALRYEPNNIYQNHIMPFRNESEPNGKVVLKPQGSFEAGIYTSELALGDFDGDGKQDAVVSSIGNAASQIKVLRNTSSAGTISFTSALSITNTGTCYYVATGDADGDGKIDFVASNYFEGKLLVYRNTGSPGNISFASPVVIEAGLTPGMIAFADFNGNGKPDIAVTNELFGKVVIFNNNSSPGSVSYAQARTIELQNYPRVENLAAADLNSDGRNDLLVTAGDLYNFSGIILAYANTGNFNFSSPQVIENTNYSGGYYKPSVGDLNGDGKPDVVVGWAGETKFGVYQNMGESGGAIRLNYTRNWFALSPFRIAIGDLNADGQPELAVASFNSTAGVGIYDNKMGKLLITNVSTFSGGQGTEVTISGFNFTGITSVKFGNTPAAAFRVVSPNSIIATVGTGASGRIEVTGAAGTDYWEEFIYDNQPYIGSFTPKIAGTGDTVVISGTNFIGTNAVKFGGVPAQWFTVVNRNTIKAIPGNGASGNVLVQNEEGIANLGGFIFPHPPVISDFKPKEGYTGGYVVVYGEHLSMPGILPTVTLAGVPCTVTSIGQDYTYVTIKIGQVGSGYLAIHHPGGSDSMAGFTFIPPPVIQSVNPLSGQPGDTLTITGRNFTGLTEFFFGDSAAAYFEVLNDSMVRAVVNHGTDGIIKAIAPHGIAQFPGFVFVPLAPPVLLTMSPTTGTTGTLVELTGDNLLGIVSLTMGTAKIKRITYNTRKKLAFYVPIGADGPVTITTYYGTATLQQPLFAVLQPPKMDSFSPLEGESGEIVTLQGSGFGSNPSSVYVYFGTNKAKIIQVQPNTIKVEIPRAAGFDFITVTVNNLTTFSKRKFNRINRSTAHLPLGSSLFGDVNPYYGYHPNPYQERTIMVDFDNDGLPDKAKLSNSWITIYRNTTVSGKIQFEAYQFPDTGSEVDYAAANDLDGDGRMDLIINPFQVLRNISTEKELLFELKEIQTERWGWLKDMNQDGKADFVVKQQEGIRIYLNNSSPGVFIFGDTLDIPIPGLNETIFQYGKFLGVGDLDSDGLEDLIFSYGEKVYLVRNTGTGKQPAFQSHIQFLAKSGEPDNLIFSPSKLVLDDLNMDGKPDLSFIHYYGQNSFSFYRNTSTPGNIKVGPIQWFNYVGSNDLKLGDFNGDGRPDLVASDGPWFNFYENKSMADSIILIPAFQTNKGRSVFNTADIDADGKTDIIIDYTPPIVFRNRLNEEQQKIICPDGNLNLQAESESTAYQWQINSGNGFSDMVNDAIISGAQTASLTLTKVPSSWFMRSFRCRLANGKFSEPYLIEFSNSWERYRTKDWHDPNNWSCGVVPDGNTMVNILPYSTIELKSNGSCRSVFMGVNANVRVLPGVQLIITGK